MSGRDVRELVRLTVDAAILGSYVGVLESTLGGLGELVTTPEQRLELAHARRQTRDLRRAIAHHFDRFATGLPDGEQHAGETANGQHGDGDASP